MAMAPLISREFEKKMLKMKNEILKKKVKLIYIGRELDIDGSGLCDEY